MRVLVVEDNSTYANLVVARLAQSGLYADLVQSGREAEHAISRMEYAAIILDLGLPDQDGLELLKTIRSRRPSTPVIIVTARTSLESRVTSLRMGADDYLAKPFSMDELVARLYALLRRPGNQLSQMLVAGNVVFDSAVRQLVVNDQVQFFRVRELAVLELLIRYKGNAVGRGIFEERLFGLAVEQESNTLDVYIHRLRKQLEEAGATVTIHTIRGLGYMLSEDKKESLP
jgi:DNA-binding response OmpR family regulator